jgi:hypothetical protein
MCLQTQTKEEFILGMCHTPSIHEEDTVTDWFFITVAESVYCSVRTYSLYKADYLVFKRLIRLENILE